MNEDRIPSDEFCEAASKFSSEKYTPRLDRVSPEKRKEFEAEDDR